MCPVLRQERTRRVKEGGWTEAQAPTQSPSPGWGFWGPQGPKGIPPVLKDKPSAHLSRPSRRPPPPAHHMQKTVVTLSFASHSLRKYLFPGALCSLRAAPSSTPAPGFPSFLEALDSLQSPHVASPLPWAPSLCHVLFPEPL